MGDAVRERAREREYVCVHGAFHNYFPRQCQCQGEVVRCLVVPRRVLYISSGFGALDRRCRTASRHMEDAVGMLSVHMCLMYVHRYLYVCSVYQGTLRDDAD